MSDEFDDDPMHEETPDEAIARLRAELDDGALSRRPELAEALIQAAHDAAGEQRFELAIERTEEAIGLMKTLIDEDRPEFRSVVGRCLLFRAALVRTRRGAEAGLVAFNEAVSYLSENLSPDEPESHSALAVALMNKADILIDPLGAHSAAIAAQSRAQRLWQNLVDEGATEYRHQLASTFLALGDSKLQTGDVGSAMPDFQRALEMAREAEEEALENAGEHGDADESELKDVLIQALMKLSKLFERLGNLSGAFDMLREVIDLVERSVASGNDRAEPALTSLYLQQGMLYERIGDPESAVVEYERSRDVYRRMLRRKSPENPLEGPIAYIVRTGLANVLMCRGNMLADLKRYDEATESFEESIRCYRESAEFRPDTDDDDTFVPYSIAVVQLNLANMLVAQKRFQEAIVIKLDAIGQLRCRYEAGHDEILPNIVSAYRKLVGIRRTLGETDMMFQEIEAIEQILAEAVDRGNLEYRSDLGSVLYLRAVLRDEAGDFDAAEKDYRLALRLFRELADDDDETADVQWAKLQWGEVLEHLARLDVRRDRVDAALLVFRKAIDDVLLYRAEGNDRLLFDALFAYSQFVEFVDSLMREESERYSREEIERRMRIALQAVDEGIEWSRRERPRIEPGSASLSEADLSLDLFFRMKIAFFRRHRASFLLYLNRFDDAINEFAAAAGEWDALLDRIVQLRLRDRYYEEERADLDAEAGRKTDVSSDVDADPYAERWKYYVGELRQTLQQWALACLGAGDTDQAERLFQRDLDMTRKMVEQNAPNAERFLILSLITFAKAMESVDQTDRSRALYEEATQRIRAQWEGEERVVADLTMLKHVFTSYALFLHKIGHTDRAKELIDEFMSTLRQCRDFPEPELWIDLCRALEIRSLWIDSPDPEEDLKAVRHEFLALHPSYGTGPEWAAYEEQPIRDSE